MKEAEQTSRSKLPDSQECHDTGTHTTVGSAVEGSEESLPCSASPLVGCSSMSQLVVMPTPLQKKAQLDGPIQGDLSVFLRCAKLWPGPRGQKAQEGKDSDGGRSTVRPLPPRLCGVQVDLERHSPTQFHTCFSWLSIRDLPAAPSHHPKV